MITSRPALLMFVFALTACIGGEPEKLLLEGPDRVSVASLGPVDGPVAVLSTGERPEGIVWEVSPAEVAHWSEGEVHAVGPGEATVIGTWEGQAVQWSVEVSLAIELRFLKPPASVRVGERVPLEVQARAGGQAVELAGYSWAARPEGVAKVDGAGVVEGVAPGTAWITASSGGNEAMVELAVVP